MNREQVMRVALVAWLILAAIGGLFLVMNTGGSDSVSDEAAPKRIVAIPKGSATIADYFEPPAEPLKYDGKVEEKYDLNKSNPASSEVFSAPKYIPPPSGTSPTAPIPPTSNIETRTSFLGLMFRLFESAFK